jgi:hypothetical protein
VLIEGTVASDGSTSLSYSTWYEWYPAGLYAISNLPVNPGDTMYISLTANSPSSGTLLFENLSQGVSVEGVIDSPSASANLAGQSVEWIVEDPSSGGGLVPFLDFGTAFFEACMAGTSTGESVDLSDSTLLTLATGNSAGVVTSILTTETIYGDELEIVYTGPS